MVDGASETLDLTLFKRNMIEFSSDVIDRYEIVKKGPIFEFFRFSQKKNVPEQGALFLFLSMLNNVFWTA